MANRRSDNTFRGALNLQVNKTIRGSLGQSDRVDFYKFRASGQVNFNLNLSGLRTNASVRLLNARRTPIAVSNQSGKRAEQISATLEGGLYYVQVQFLDRRGTTRYNLRTSATPTPPTIEDGTLATASDLGSLTTTTIRQNSVGANDPADFYRFTLPDIANLQVRVTGSNSGTRFALIQDSNANGLVDNNEIVTSGSSFGANSPADATQTLPQGAYFIQIESTSTQSTPYQLELIPAFFGGNVAPDPGNTLATASDLGVFSGTRPLRDYVGPLDTTDFYRFTLNDLSNLQITRIGSSRNPEVQLIRDSNNNGLIDSGEIFLSDNSFAIVSNRATTDLPVGTYFIRVEAQSPISYEMTLVGTPYGGNGLPDPGNTIPAARDLGVLSGVSSLKEYVGELDSSDFYKFTVATPINFQATSSSTNSIDLLLIRDTNNNGFIETSERLRSGIGDIRSLALQAGTYFVSVEPRFRGQSTNYDLSLIST
jgi:hypothetical protein